MGELRLPSNNSKIDLDSNDLGRPDTLRYNILTFVINEEYDRAIKMIKDFIAADSEYPNFKLKTERYALHAIDLIYAIRTKRNFPGLGGLTRSKQQELKEKFTEHFSELRLIMRKIDNCLEELRLDDVKSTKIVVRSFWLATVTVFCAGLVIEFMQGLGTTFQIVVADKLDNFITMLIGRIF